MTEKSQGRALVLGLAAVLLWSTVATAFKLALAYLTPLQLLAIASVVSTLVLALAVSWQRAWGDVGEAWRNGRWRYIGLGFLNPFFYYFILFKAYDLLPAQQAQPLNYTWALTLSLLAVPLLGQRLHGRDFVAMAMGYGGVLVIATRGDVLGLQFDSPLGVALALGSTIIWALYWILNARSQESPVVGLLLCFLTGLPWVLAAAWLSDGFPQDWNGVTAAVYVGFFEMGVTFMLWLGALKTAVHASRVSNLIFLSPFLSLIFISQILGESIHPTVYIGLLLIVGGVILQQWKRRN
ncbi:membrane protein [Marinobacterium nitratireducens]|uniref:Membrane protein n=1 Tax=Marinobacterium nitratireducens TaxID=518897 RepID=A0A917ZNE1_9GAMM|nr:DMT family transporter [Marinobacterium nitratireducens]GGO86794.1 membrane protein [Marinobacterium nitratireducens]